jgi:hypothetical protein
MKKASPCVSTPTPDKDARFAPDGHQPCFQGPTKGILEHMSHPPTDTQQGQPSGQDPMKEGRRLGFSWILFPVAVIVVLAVIFGLKFLLS